MRDLYLKDITLYGSTAWDEPVFPQLIGYVERNELRPLLAKTFALEHIAEAQREFLEKKHVGNFVLIPASALRCAAAGLPGWPAGLTASRPSFRIPMLGQHRNPALVHHLLEAGHAGMQFVVPVLPVLFVAQAAT